LRLEELAERILACRVENVSESRVGARVREKIRSVGVTQGPDKSVTALAMNLSVFVSVAVVKTGGHRFSFRDPRLLKRSDDQVGRLGSPNWAKGNPVP
jgi:hypothetical protein